MHHPHVDSIFAFWNLLFKCFKAKKRYKKKKIQRGNTTAANDSTLRILGELTSLISIRLFFPWLFPYFIFLRQRYCNQVYIDVRSVACIIFRILNLGYENVNGVNRLATKGKKYYQLPTKREKNYRLPTGKTLPTWTDIIYIFFFRRESILYFFYLFRK